MSLTLVKPKPTIRPARRKHHCACGRYLGESMARDGYIVVKCQGCGTWRRLSFGGVVK